MEKLLAKICGVGDEQKCVLLQEVWAEAEFFMQRAEFEVDRDGVKLNHSELDKKLDELEEVFQQWRLKFNFPVELRAELQKQYGNMMDDLKNFYGVIEEEPESPGKFFYIADYDGSKEAGGKGMDFSNEKFSLPTFEEILERLTIKAIKLYWKMEKEGLEPKLQITPIAYNIRSLGKKIDAKRADLNVNKEDTFIGPEIKDEELQYAPTSITAIKGGKEIEVKGGKSKSEWIKENRGYLIDIVATKANLKTDPEIQETKNGEVNYGAVQAERYARKLNKAGYTPMSCESYLVAQMIASKANVFLEDWKENKTYTLLLESSLINSRYLAVSDWGDVRVRLGRLNTDHQGEGLRVRGSVRVL